MAKLNGIGTGLTGTAGDWNYYRRGNVTYARQKAIRSGNEKRSIALMTQRVKFNNPLNLWRSAQGTMKHLFETRKEGQSAYNAFMSVNMKVTEVYLPKDVAQLGGCVVDNYTISMGTLTPAIGTRMAGGKAVTDLRLGDLVIDSNTTVSQFAKAIIKYNNGRMLSGAQKKHAVYRPMDEIQLYLCEQKLNRATMIPTVTTEAFTLVLDKDDSRPLWEVVPEECFASVDGYLGAKEEIDGAMAYVHVRKTDDSTLVSTQQLVGKSSMFDLYSSAEALKQSIQSMGGISSDECLEDIEDMEDDMQVEPEPEYTQHTVSVQSADAAKGTVSGSGTYPEGAEAVLRATANSGFRFVRWSDGNTQNPRTVTVMSNLTLQAIFESTSGGSQGGYDSGN